MHARCFATVIFSVHLFLVCEFLFRKLWYVKIFNFNLTCVWIFLKKILLWLINPCKPMIVHCVSVMINKASYALECLVYVTFSYAINLEYWSCDESCNSSVLHRSPLINTFRYTVTAYQWGTMILLATSPFFFIFLNVCFRNLVVFLIRGLGYGAMQNMSWNVVRIRLHDLTTAITVKL